MSPSPHPNSSGHVLKCDREPLWRVAGAGGGGAQWHHLVATGLHQVVGGAQRQGTDRRRGIDPARRDEAAAVDDVEVGYVVRPVPLVDDRCRRVRAHAGRSEQVPARVAHQAIDLDRVGAGLDERLGCLVDVEVEQAPGVVRDPVVELGGRQSRGVGGRRRQRDAVRLVGQILTEQTPTRRRARGGCAREGGAPRPRPARPLGSAGRR